MEVVVGHSHFLVVRHMVVVAVAHRTVVDILLAGFEADRTVAVRTADHLEAGHIALDLVGGIPAVRLVEDILVADRSLAVVDLQKVGLLLHPCCHTIRAY